jgi:hypothetical protein
MPTPMNRSLFGLLIVGVAFLPWIVEVFYQVGLQARFLKAMPPDARAALPAHPKRAALAFLSSTRFHLALWRYARRDLPTDPPDVADLKRQVRASLKREALWLVLGLATVVILVVRGWRPTG